MYTLTPADKNHIRKKQYLSKSDFKLALDCPVKVYYKKKNYAAAGFQDDYMQLLAECGYIVGKMAQLYYPSGIEIEDNVHIFSHILK